MNHTKTIVFQDEDKKITTTYISVVPLPADVTSTKEILEVEAEKFRSEGRPYREFREVGNPSTVIFVEGLN